MTMVPSQVDLLENQRQAIDAKVKSLEDSGSIRALRSHRNTLAPILSLPVELTDGIFSYLRLPGISPPFTRGEKAEKKDPLAWLRVAHVCHHWREIALNQPLFWSYVNFTNLSLAGAAEVLTRAKTAPLYLEAKIRRRRWDDTQYDDAAKLAAFKEELQQHLSQIRYLDISAMQTHLYKTLQALVSPAPILEHLSLSFEVHTTISSPFPNALFNGTMPRLSHLELRCCDISWESPLFKRLTYLDIRSPSYEARPGLATWLDSLGEMSQLRTLILHSASPVSPTNASPPFEVEHTITLPFLTHLDISAPPWDCAIALAHLNLPALARLSITTRVHSGWQLHRILPYVAIHAHGPQDAQTIQSMLIYSGDMRVDMLMWTVPGIGFDVRDSSAFLDGMLSARVLLSVVTKARPKSKTHMRMFDEAITALPLDNLVTLTVPDCTFFNWRCHVPRWRLLQCVRLGLPAANALRKILLHDKRKLTRSLLPSLTKLTLVDAELTGTWILDLCNTLMKRVEKGVPLEVVDLRTCTVTGHAAIQQLIEIVSVVWNPSEEICGTRKPDFTTSYSEAHTILVKDNSEPRSDDEDGSDFEEVFNPIEADEWYPEDVEESSEYSE
jgi:hypothetical protein